MIKQHAAPRALGWTGFSLLCLLAATLLPLSATLAQQATAPPAGLPPTGPAAEPPPATGAAPAAGDIAVGIAAATADNNDPNAAAQREAQALVEELKKTSEEIAQLTARLRTAQARLAELQRTTMRVNNAQIGQPFGEGMAGPPAMNPNTARRNRTNGYGQPMTEGTLVPTNNDQERRLRTVEQKLDRLIEELHAARPDRPETPGEIPRPGVRR